MVVELIAKEVELSKVASRHRLVFPWWFGSSAVSNRFSDFVLDPNLPELNFPELIQSPTHVKGNIFDFVFTDN